MRCVRVHERTAIVGVTMYDLGIIMDALSATLDETQLSPSRLDGAFRVDTKRLQRQILTVLAAMDGRTAEGDDIPTR